MSFFDNAKGLLGSSLDKAFDDLRKVVWNRITTGEPASSLQIDLTRSIASILYKLDQKFPSYDVLKDLSELCIRVGYVRFSQEAHGLIQQAGKNRRDSSDFYFIYREDRNGDIISVKISSFLMEWERRIRIGKTTPLRELIDISLPSWFETVSVDDQKFFKSLNIVQRNLENTSDIITTAPVVVAKGVEFFYSNGLGLNRFDFIAEEGQIVVCVGPNGSGKTTFLKLLTSQLKPTKGSITYPLIDAAAVSNAIISARVKDIATMMTPDFSAQMPIDLLISYNLAQNGIVGDKNAITTKLMVERFRLHGLSSREPQFLSTGQRVLAALAIALSRAPKLLVLDEPLAPLDYLAMMTFIDDLYRISNGELLSKTCIIFSTHSLNDLNRFADRLIFFDNGSLEEMEFESGKKVYEIIPEQVEDIPALIGVLTSNDFHAEVFYNKVYVIESTALEMRDIASTISSIKIHSIANISKEIRRKYLRLENE